MQAAFTSQEQKRYWELWLENKGDARKVATDCGVTYETVQQHLKRVASGIGFRSFKEARKRFGFKTRAFEADCVSADDLKALLEMQGYRCALSGVRLEPATAELDHKIPLSRGGTNDLGNLQWLSRDVNRAKGTMDNEEFVKLCKKIAR